jgi:hypothetical protein
MHIDCILGEDASLQQNGIVCFEVVVIIFKVLLPAFEFMLRKPLLSIP